MSVEEHDGGGDMLCIGVFTIIPLFTAVTRVEGKCCEPLHNIRLLFAAYVYLYRYLDLI